MFIARFGIPFSGLYVSNVPRIVPFCVLNVYLTSDLSCVFLY